MIKKRLIKLALLAGYLNITLLSVGYRWSALFDLKLLLLVAVGMVCLSIPELFSKYKLIHVNLSTLAGILGKSAIPAGIIQSFLLLFSESSKYGAGRSGPYQAALCFRPLFYGYCLFVLLGTEETEKKADKRGAADAQRIPPEPENAAECPTLSLSGAMGEPARRQLRDMGLTAREAEIGLLLLKGRSNGETAIELTISETTVKKHVSNIFQKLGISRREQLLDAIMKRSPSVLS